MYVNVVQVNNKYIFQPVKEDLLVSGEKDMIKLKLLFTTSVTKRYELNTAASARWGSILYKVRTSRTRQRLLSDTDKSTLPVL